MNLFISYAHEDEVFRVEIEKFLVMLSRQKLINIWSDRKIGPGSDWDHEINDNLRKSKVILLLVSQDFLNSDYCYDIEIKMDVATEFENGEVMLPPNFIAQAFGAKVYWDNNYSSLMIEKWS